LISELRERLDARYRIVYTVGAIGNVKNRNRPADLLVLHGDTLLYNPDRLQNLSPSDVAGRP
jgi:hypothetical protein